MRESQSPFKGLNQNISLLCYMESLPRIVILCYLLSLSLVFISCMDTAPSLGDGPDTDEIYFDYKVWGGEETGYVTTKLQFRHRNRMGTPFRLEPPFGVELDGQVLEPDSSAMNGVYYEASYPIEEFIGQHSIVFTGSDSSLFKEEFRFNPISFSKEIGEIVPRDNLEIFLAGAEDSDRVRIIMMDTAAFSEGVDRTYYVKNGSVTVDSFEISTLKPGPVYLEVHTERERRVKNGTLAGGRISLSYSLKRMFQLAD